MSRIEIIPTINNEQTSLGIVQDNFLKSDHLPEINQVNTEFYELCPRGVFTNSWSSTLLFELNDLIDVGEESSFRVNKWDWNSSRLMSWLEILAKKDFDMPEDEIRRLVLKNTEVGYSISIEGGANSNEVETRIYYAFISSIAEVFNGYIIPNPYGEKWDERFYSIDLDIYSVKGFQQYVKKHILNSFL